METKKWCVAFFHLAPSDIFNMSQKVTEPKEFKVKLYIQVCCKHVSPAIEHARGHDHYPDSEQNSIFPFVWWQPQRQEQACQQWNCLPLWLQIICYIIPSAMMGTALGFCAGKS